MQAQRTLVRSCRQNTQKSSMGFGKLKGRAIKIHIDPNVKPVAQPIRRTPFSLRSKVEAKIQELVDLDIIEPAQGPTTWVNPVVVVPKSGGFAFA